MLRGPRRKSVRILCGVFFGAPPNFCKKFGGVHWRITLSGASTRPLTYGKVRRASALMRLSRSSSKYRALRIGGGKLRGPHHKIFDFVMGQIGDLLCQPPYSDLLRTTSTLPRCNTRLTSQTPPENGGVAFACARLRLCASSKCWAFTCSAFCGTKLSTCSLISSPRCFYGAFAHLIRISRPQ